MLQLILRLQIVHYFQIKKLLIATVHNRGSDYEKNSL